MMPGGMPHPVVEGRHGGRVVQSRRSSKGIDVSKAIVECPTCAEVAIADKYRGSGQPIHLIGVEFSKETRHLAAFEAAPV